MALLSGERSPGAKFALTILVGLLLTIPLFTVWLLVYDRQSQSETARASIASGWGGPQVVAGPILVIPYQAEITETVTEGNQQVTRSRRIWRELTLAPLAADLQTLIKPERRQRSIYEAVVYETALSGNARFALPTDLGRFGVSPGDLALDRAELRFGLSDARGLFGAPPRVSVAGQQLGLQPGGGTPATNGSGFFSWLDARSLLAGPLASEFAFSFRGNGWLAVQPLAGDTRWTVRSRWPHPSFQGGFLPVTRSVTPEGFTATYRVGNLALGRSLVSTGDAASRQGPPEQRGAFQGAPAGDYEARVDLVQPVDLYDRVSRSAKYGFLFIGFTFLALLLFDVIGGVRVSPVDGACRGDRLHVRLCRRIGCDHRTEHGLCRSRAAQLAPSGLYRRVARGALRRALHSAEP